MNLTWHFDFHTPGYVRVGEECDSESVAEALGGTGVEGVIIFAKCHFGYSYYPTKVGTPHPKLAVDLFGKLLNSVRRRGMRVASYVSFGIDGAAGEEHPDWRRVYADGSSDPGGWFVNMCPFTPYLGDRVLPQIEELFHLYRPDGYWFDTMSALAPCYCETCREEFREHSRHELPVDENDPLQIIAGTWRHQRGFALVERVGAFIHRLDPSASVGFNQLGSLPYPEPMPSGVTVLTLDPETTGPQSIPFSLNAAYGSHASQPCEIMPTIFHGGWGDWSPAPALRLETTALACWIRGTTLVVGDRLHPEGRLAEPSVSAMKLIASTRAKWMRAEPAPGACLEPDIVVLHSPSLTNGPDCRFFAVGDPRSRLTPVNGMHRLLLDAGLNSTVAAEWQLEEVLNVARLIVVPEIPALTLDTEKRLKRFVESGGSVLFSGKIPSVEGRPFLDTGVLVGEAAWQDHAYLPGFENPLEEILVRGEIRETRILDASVESFLIPAYDAKPGLRYGWGIGPSSGLPSANPALTRRAVGTGAIWYLNAMLASDYARIGNWPQVPWFAELVAETGVSLRARLLQGAGNLELTVWEDARSTWIYLLSHDSEQLVGEGKVWARSTASADKRKASVQMAVRKGTPTVHPLSGETTLISSNSIDLTLALEFERPFAAARIDWN